MPWIDPNAPPPPPPQQPVFLIPLQQLPSRFSNVLSFMQALPAAEGLAFANNMLTTMHALEQEETHRQQVQAEKEVRLAQMESGSKLISQLVTREYDNKDLAVKTLGQAIQTMAQLGNNDAALELSRLLLEKTLSGEFVRHLLEFRNQYASGGMIEIRAINGTK